MPRYIDAEQAIHLIENDALSQIYYSKSDAIDCINATPTSDVVSKSEYDILKKSFKELIQEAKGYLNRIYGIRYDIAIEIFDEIDKILKTQEKYLYCNPSLTYVCGLIEDLKKKYI